MCEWGDTTKIWVTIPAHLSHTGEDYRKYVGVDSCIADFVQMLNDNGIETVASCCGHGKQPASIILRNDTWLMFLTREDALEVYKKHPPIN